MAYGERKGARKDPGDYGVFDMLGLGIAASFGIAVATFFDLTQSDETSALFVFNKWLATVTQILGLGNIPLYGVVLILMAIGAASILYFQPVTFRGAFAQGFGALAAIMTLAPSNLGGAMPAPIDFNQPLDPSSAFPSMEEDDAWPEEETLEGISFPLRQDQGAPSLVPVSSATAALMTTAALQQNGYSIRMKVVFTEGIDKTQLHDMIRKGTLRGKLHNEATKATFNIFRNTGANLNVRNNTIYLASRIPGRADSANLVTRIEAEGYRIVESRFSATLGVNPVWTIRLQPSNTPLIFQRLNRPYWF
ncbi:MAG: hypothetical protein AAF603_03485 [Pseudomonadota bacterium]